MQSFIYIMLKPMGSCKCPLGPLSAFHFLIHKKHIIFALPDYALLVLVKDQFTVDYIESVKIYGLILTNISPIFGSVLIIGFTSLNIFNY